MKLSEAKKMKKKEKKVEYHDSCPKCNRKMQKTDKDKKGLFFYCRNCKQKYRVYPSHKSQIVNCPHCNKEIRVTKHIIDQLHMNTVFNFVTKKVKV